MFTFLTFVTLCHELCNADEYYLDIHIKDIHVLLWISNPKHLCDKNLKESVFFREDVKYPFNHKTSVVATAECLRIFPQFSI